MIEGLVQRLEDVTPERWDDPVRGSLTFRTLFSRGVTPTCALTAGFAELGPGDRLAAHRHPQSEVYLVVEGEGVVRVDDEEVGVTAGTVLFMPGGSVHEVVNTSPTRVLRVFYVLDADGMEDVEYEFVDDSGAGAEEEAARRPAASTRLRDPRPGKGS